MTLTVAGEPLVAFLLASVRILAWLAVVPPFAGRAVPMMAKLVLSLGLAFAVAPAGDSIPLDTVGLLFNVGTQVLIGAAMGFVTHLLLAAVTAALGDATTGRNWTTMVKLQALCAEVAGR